MKGYLFRVRTTAGDGEAAEKLLLCSLTFRTGRRNDYRVAVQSTNPDNLDNLIRRYFAPLLPFAGKRSKRPCQTDFRSHPDIYAPPVPVAHKEHGAPVSSPPRLSEGCCGLHCAIIGERALTVS
jgi:hypothetical protein